MLQYDPCYKGFLEEIDSNVCVFGPRVARAIMLYALVSGDQFVKEGLRISYRELKVYWPQAVQDGLFGSKWRCGLVTLLHKIEVGKNKQALDEGFDDVVQIIKNLNHQVFNELCALSVGRKTVKKEGMYCSQSVVGE